MSNDKIRVTINDKNKINASITKKPGVFVNQSGLVVRRISDLVDVNLDNLEDGSLLIYDIEEEKFVASRLLDKQQINGGHF